MVFLISIFIAAVVFNLLVVWSCRAMALVFRRNHFDRITRYVAYAALAVVAVAVNYALVASVANILR